MYAVTTIKLIFSEIRWTKSFGTNHITQLIFHRFVRIISHTDEQMPLLCIWSDLSSSLISSSIRIQLHLFRPIHPIVFSIHCLSSFPFRLHLFLDLYFISSSVRKAIYLHLSVSWCCSHQPNYLLTSNTNHPSPPASSQFSATMRRILCF